MRLRIEVFQCSFPMAIVVGHSKTTQRVARNVVVRLEVDETWGIGECVPRPYVTGETPESVFEAVSTLDLTTISRQLETRSFHEAIRSIEAMQLDHKLGDESRVAPAAACAVELALVDAVCRKFREPIAAVPAAIGLSPEVTHPARIYRATATWDLIRSLDDVAGLFGPEFPRLKIKAGLRFEEDVARVRKARDVLGDQVAFSLDSNMAWSVEETVRISHALRGLGVDWYEEPLAPTEGLDGYRQLRRDTDVRVMLDESLCTMEDAKAAADQAAADLFNIRISKCGGFIRSLRIAEFARLHGIGLQVGAQLGETAILSAAGRHLTSLLTDIQAYDWNPTTRFFDEQTVEEDLAWDYERLAHPLIGGDGLGVTPKLDTIRKYADRRHLGRSG